MGKVGKPIVPNKNPRAKAKYGVAKYKATKKRPKNVKVEKKGGDVCSMF